MSRWRVVVILVLFTAPFVVLMGVGSYHLFRVGWIFAFTWSLIACVMLALGLAYYWQRRKVLMPRWNFDRLPHGSPRDQEAWALVEARAKAAEQVPAALLTDPQYYLELSQEMALEMAQFYHPGAKDPYGSLTVPEILSVAELATNDLRRLVETYVPGSHLLTVNQYKQSRQAIDWYKKSSNVYMAIAAVFDPIHTAARYLAARYGAGGMWDLLQQNVLTWFYAEFVKRLGSYLIELHSGRLRVGADRYRQLINQHSAPGTDADAPTQTEAHSVPSPDVTITLMGQVKAGKSSLVNALLGEQKAQTDILPLTNEITRYAIRPANVDSQLALLDTVGYGHEGPTEDQLRATEEAARLSDALFLVLHARNPARQADVQLLDRLKTWFAANPSLREPPIIAVVSHIDLLTPAMEWAPPYDWLDPQRPKELHIRAALTTVRDQFGDRLAAIVPVCTTPGKVFGIEEGLLPALVERLGEARSVALLRVLKAEADQGQIRRVVSQLMAAGRAAAALFWQTSK